MTVVDVAQERGLVEARVEVGEGEPLGDRRVERQQVAQGCPLVGGAQGRALDDRVGLIAPDPGLLDQRDEDAAAGVQAEAARDVLAHPLGADDQAFEQPGHPHEHVVEQRSSRPAGSPAPRSNG